MGRPFSGRLQRSCASRLGCLLLPAPCTEAAPVLRGKQGIILLLFWPVQMGTDRYRQLTASSAHTMAPACREYSTPTSAGSAPFQQLCPPALPSRLLLRSAEPAGQCRSPSACACTLSVPHRPSGYIPNPIFLPQFF